jgi:hypothetical protein
MNAYQFMSNSPGLTFFVVWLVAHHIAYAWNRLMRHLNIRKHGWPPAHCDADGDFQKSEGSHDAVPD